MKLLLTGANGLLGQKIVEKALLSPEIALLATSKGENRNHLRNGYKYLDLDITSREDVLEACRAFKPDVIINTAAMTNVDDCEKEKEKCWSANVVAVENLVEAAKENNSHLVHLSTDFVFDGKNGPYSENDPPNPLSYYGESKLASEKAVMDSGLANWAIARTIIVYGVGHQLSRSNIVLWAKKMLEDHQEIKIVDDQFRSPTLAEDLADGCLRIAFKKARGIFHLSGPEVFSIFELVTHVAEYFNLDRKLIRPVKTGEFTQPAARPLKTGFDISKARKVLGYDPRKLHDALTLISYQLKEKVE